MDMNKLSTSVKSAAVAAVLAAVASTSATAGETNQSRTADVVERFSTLPPGVATPMSEAELGAVRGQGETAKVMKSAFANLAISVDPYAHRHCNHGG
jgi:hypothetical protein